MIDHYIILSSSYSEGKRICLHFPGCDDDYFHSIIKKVRGAFGGKRVSFSTHTVLTESEDWDSVQKYDPYFEDVEEIKDVDKFIQLIQRDRYCTSVDIARYILSIYPCTHTRLEKLTYFCYADYLCKTGCRLFTDKVFAFKHGPVIEGIYHKYSQLSREHPHEFIREGCDYMALMSRIRFSENGRKMISSIDSTLEKLKGVSTQKLISITHVEGSPWSRIYDGKDFTPISDELIQKYHYLEY